MMPAAPTPPAGKYLSGWLWLAVALTLFKLWLTRSQTIYALAPAIHDDRLFLELAAALLRGEWLGTYNEFTLAKGPFYSMWIAAMHVLGIPLGLSQQLAYAGGCALLVIALGPLFARPATRTAAYLLLLWNPMSFEGPNLTRILRQNIYTPLGLVIFAGLIALYVRRNKPVSENLAWAITLGLAFGCFWLTREESIWIIPSVCLLGAALLYVSPWRLGAWKRPAILIGAAVISAAAPILTVSYLNYQHYGWFGTVEFRATAFKDAYGALQRIKAGPELANIPITKEARLAAYAESPMFAQLRSRFEGELGARWAYKEEGYQAADREIAGGWFVWALREAVQRSGFAPDAASALLFYRYMADEINAACDEGRIPAGPRRSGFFPKWQSGYTRKLGPAFLEYAGYFTTFAAASPRVSPSQGEPAELKFFEDITGERITPPADRPDFSSPRQQDLDRSKLRFLEAFTVAGRQVLTVLIVAAHLIWLARLGQALRQRALTYPLVVATAAWGGALAYLAVNLLVHVTSYPNISPSAMSSAYPLLLLFVIAVGIDAARSWEIPPSTLVPSFARHEPVVWAVAGAGLVFAFKTAPFFILWPLALLVAGVSHWLRSHLSFLPALFAAMAAIVSALFMPADQGWFALSIALGFFHVRGVLEAPAGTRVWWIALALGAVVVTLTPQAWALPLAAGAALLWGAPRGKLLRLAPLSLGLIALLVSPGRLESHFMGGPFVPAFLSSWERNLRWPADWPGAGILILIPGFLHALFLRARRETPPFDGVILACWLSALFFAGDIAWRHAGSIENLFAFTAPALLLGLAASAAALMRLLQSANQNSKWSVWILAIIWSTVVFYGFRDLGMIFDPLVKQWPWVGGLAAAIALGAFLLPRDRLRAGIVSPLPLTGDFALPGLLALPGVIAAILLSMWGQPSEENLDFRWRNILSPRSAESTLKFEFTSPAPLSADRIVGAADLSPVYIRNFFHGTRLNGPAFTGTLTSKRFKPDSRWLVIPVAGFPSAPGNRLEVQIENDAGDVLGLIVFKGANPAARVNFWQVDLAEHANQYARIRLVDGRTDTDSWLAVAPPIRTGDATRAFSLQRKMDWAPYIGPLQALRWIVKLSLAGFLVALGCNLLRRAGRQRKLGS